MFKLKGLRNIVYRINENWEVRNKKTRIHKHIGLFKTTFYYFTFKNTYKNITIKKLAPNMNRI